MNSLKTRTLIIAAISLLSILPTYAASPDDTAQHLTIRLGDIQKLQVSGFLQSHYELVDDGGKQTNGFDIRHAVLIANAQLTRRLSFLLMVDVAGASYDKYLHEYYAQYDFMPELKLRIGQFKQPFTLENIMPPFLMGTLNMNESVRQMAGVAGDPLYGNMAGRDAGIMLTGDLLPTSGERRLINYSVGLFNGAGLNQRDNNPYKDLVAMLKVTPLQWLTLTTSGIIGKGTARSASPFNSIAEGQDYIRQRWSVGLELRHRIAYLRSEYMLGRDGDARSRGGYAEACIHLTSRLDLLLDYDSHNRNTALSLEEQRQLPAATQTNNYLIGLQYWIYKHCRIATQYLYCDRRTGPDTRQWVTQMQITF